MLLRLLDLQRQHFPAMQPLAFQPVTQKVPSHRDSNERYFQAILEQNMNGMVK